MTRRVRRSVAASSPFVSVRQTTRRRCDRSVLLLLGPADSGPPEAGRNTLNKPDPSAPSDDQPLANDALADKKTDDEGPISPSSPWKQSAVFRFVGLGTELAGFTLVFAGLGYLMDKFGQNPKPYGTALGALIGFSLGMVRFIQQARKSDD